MDNQIKRAVKAGNSSAVILPRAWLGKEVRIELLKKSPEKMLHETIDIAKRYINLKDIIGIYLTGSYARGEEDEYSDIDILIVTENVDKKLISEGIYNILIVSSQLINQKLERDLLPIGQMVKEAKPILNAKYLDSFEVRITKKNTEWVVKTTEDKLGLIKKTIDISRKRRRVDDAVAYTLILRIRTMHIIEKLMKGEDYSKNNFVKIIRDLSNDAYEGYLAIKNNSARGKGISIEEAERLYRHLDRELERVKGKLENLK